jgi:hypothetical protein
LAIPRRRLSQAVPDGKAIIPAKTVLQQIADILKTPVIQAGVIERPAAMHRSSDQIGPQVTEEEEGKSNAGGSAEGNDADAQTRAVTKALADVEAAAAANTEATAAQANAAKEKALAQATQVQEQEPTNPEVPLSQARRKESAYPTEGQLGSTAKEVAGAGGCS